MSKFEVFHVRETGASHIKSSKPCQDYALTSVGSEYAVAIVCDGHGGNKYIRSDRGSRQAAEQTMTAIHEFMRSRFKKSQQGGKIVDTLLESPDKFMVQLASNIIFRWRESVSLDFVNEPFTEKEKETLTPKDLTDLEANEGWVSAYGTTLIAAVYTKKFWFGLHIGDGKCVVMNKQSEFSQPIPWDEKCFLNQTTSLCDAQALSRFRYYFDKENLPLAIFLGSDGVDDTFGTDEALHGFYKTVFQLFSEKGIAEGNAELQKYLPQLSSKGSQDDISIAGIFHSGSNNKSDLIISPTQKDH